MKARDIRRRRCARCNGASINNPAMERRAEEREWRITDRMERRIPRRLRPTEDHDGA